MSARPRPQIHYVVRGQDGLGIVLSRVGRDAADAVGHSNAAVTLSPSRSPMDVGDCWQTWGPFLPAARFDKRPSRRMAARSPTTFGEPTPDGGLKFWREVRG